MLGVTCARLPGDVWIINPPIALSNTAPGGIEPDLPIAGARSLERTRAGIAFVAVEDPGITVSITPEWMVSRTADPFTLLSTQTPSIP